MDIGHKRVSAQKCPMSIYDPNRSFGLWSPLFLAPIYYYMGLSLLRLVLISLLLIGQVRAAEEAASGLNPEVLSAGVVHNEGYYLPRGLKVPVSLNTPLDTRLTQAGDQVTGQVMEDIMVGDYIIIPANSFVHGYISEFKGPGRFGRNPKLELTFDTISLPSGNGRRFVNIKASVKEKVLFKDGIAVTDSSMTYKRKKMIFGATAGLGGAAGAYVMTAFVRPFSSYGIGGMLDKMTILGTGATTAYLATKMLKKDDMRIESGSVVEMMLDAPAVETFAEDHHFSHDVTRELALDADPGLAYDQVTELKSIPLSSER